MVPEETLEGKRGAAMHTAAGTHRWGPLEAACTKPPAMLCFFAPGDSLLAPWLARKTWVQPRCQRSTLHLLAVPPTSFATQTAAASSRLQTPSWSGSSGASAASAAGVCVCVCATAGQQAPGRTPAVNWQWCLANGWSARAARAWHTITAAPYPTPMQGRAGCRAAAPAGSRRACGDAFASTAPGARQHGHRRCRGTGGSGSSGDGCCSQRSWRAEEPSTPLSRICAVLMRGRAGWQ